MAKRRVERGPGRDDESVAVGLGPPVAARGNATDHLLGLQRACGNTAVTTMVQRRSRAASTDVPGTRPRPAAVEEHFEDLAPQEANPKYADTDNAGLSEKAASLMDSDVRNSLLWAAELWEERWFRTKHSGDGRAVALNLYRVYRKLGDDKRTQFWLAVLQGRHDPRANEEDDMTGKEF